MNLQECLDRLARGKISNLSLCERGEVKEAFIPKVIDAVNDGIIKLYSAFPIKEKELLVELLEGKTNYELTSEHSWRNQDMTVDPQDFDHWNYYIIDTDENPFEDDILQILEIWDDLERKRPLNDPDSPLSVFTPERNLIIVNQAIKGRVLNIVYRAKHALLTEDDLETEIDIPEILYSPLMSYAAYSLHNDLNTENAVSNGSKYFTEYQNAINEINLLGLFTPDKLISDFKFIKRGWV